MNRTLACIAVVLGVLLVAGLMRAQDGVPQTASQPRKLPSSVGRLLTASPEEYAERLALLAKLERPITMSIEDKALRECISKVLAEVDIRPVFDDQSLSDDGSVSFDDHATVQAEEEPVRVVLKRLFRKPGLAWMHRDGQFVVTTQTEYEAHLDSMVYDVTDLVTNSKGEAKPWVLADLLAQHVHPECWQDVGGSGSIEWMTRPRVVLLVVRQTPAIHMELSHVLTTLREMGLSSQSTGEIVELPRPPAPPVQAAPVGRTMCAPFVGF